MTGIKSSVSTFFYNLLYYLIFSKNYVDYKKVYLRIFSFPYIIIFVHTFTISGGKASKINNNAFPK